MKNQSNSNLHHDFERVLNVIKSITSFEQYPVAMKYSTLFFSKWQPEIKKENVFTDMYMKVLLTSKAVLKSLPSKQTS